MAHELFFSLSAQASLLPTCLHQRGALPAALCSLLFLTKAVWSSSRSTASLLITGKLCRQCWELFLPEQEVAAGLRLMVRCSLSLCKKAKISEVCLKD